MRIALMTNNYKPFIGGVPISVERLAKGLEQMGHQVTVFAPAYKEQQEESNCFRYSSLMQKFIGGIVLPNPLDRRIEEEFRKNRYDIIHVHHPILIGQTAIYLSRKYNIPLTFTYHTRYEQYLCYIKGIRMLERGAAKNAFHERKTFHGTISRMERKVLYGIQDKLVPAYLKTFLRNCQHVFAPTAGMKEYLVETCGFSKDCIDILPTGIEERHFQVTEEESAAIRRKYQTEGIPLFLSVSRMAHEKNVTFLLESIARLKQKWSKPFRLLLIGDGPGREEYEETCRKLQIEQEVVFAGKVPNKEIAPYYAAADAFLFASKTETQGIVILEAFAGATPVIALNATGVSDLVIDGVNGFLCPENNGEKHSMEIFTDRITDFLTNRPLAAKLSDGALQCSMEYREEAVALRAFDYYNKIIAEYHMAGEAQNKNILPTVLMG